MNELRFGGRCEKHLSIKPCEQCYAESQQSGFFDLPTRSTCTDPSHHAPTHLYIPPGKGYRHVCPSCGKVQTLIAPQIT